MPEKGFYYANSVAIALSQFDATLVFQRRSVPSGVTPTVGSQPVETGVAQETDVVMSLGHLKVLAASMLEAIHNYEVAQKASIQVPAGMESKLGDAIKLYLAAPSTDRKQ